ncbi:MAG: response regulator [Gammaproteobacteria bacterium]|nr:response regulator [Gammaproteobacteria bacterium]
MKEFSATDTSLAKMEAARLKSFVPKLLFVDDEQSVLDALRRVCRTMKCDVFVATSGIEGLSIMAREEIDLVVSDMRMPVMTGAEFLEQVAIKHSTTIRILLTGYADIDSTIAAINQGKIHSYLSKPWDNEQFKNVLDQALHTKRLEDEHQRLQVLTQKQNEQLKILNDTLEEKVVQRTTALRQTLSNLDAAHAQLNNTYATSVQVFSRLLEFREGKKVQNSQQVAENASMLASRLGIDKESIQQLYFAALLCNIGKMALPDAVSHVPFDKLNTRQKHVYKKYPAIGEALLVSIESLQQAAGYIRNHREHIDGTGFPDGLKGREIPLPARILSVVSSYSKLLNGRPGEPQQTSIQAKAYLKSQVSKRYDEAVVIEYLKMLAEQQSTLGHTRAIEVGASDLIGGMVLAKDLITPDGLLLLSSKHVLKKSLIERIRRFEEEAEQIFSISVYADKEQ